MASNTPPPDPGLAQVEDWLIEALDELKRDRDREKHFRQRVRKGIEKVEHYRRTIIMRNPGYVFRVKVPHVPLRVTERPRINGRANYGHHTKFAWKVIKAAKSGSFDALVSFADKAKWLDKNELKKVESLRQALFGLARRGGINYTERTKESPGIFSLKDQ